MTEGSENNPETVESNIETDTNNSSSDSLNLDIDEPNVEEKSKIISIILKRLKDLMNCSVNQRMTI